MNFAQFTQKQIKRATDQAPAPALSRDPISATIPIQLILSSYICKRFRGLIDIHSKTAINEILVKNDPILAQNPVIHTKLL
jgi:hypothetical protein